MINIPEVKIGIVAVSRDCFPEELSVNRRKALVDAYKAKYDAADIYECPVCIVESEIHMEQALADVKAAGCNALVVYLGNFGPEISETMLAQNFDDRPCLSQQQKKARTTCAAAAATLTAECLMPATI